MTRARNQSLARELMAAPSVEAIQAAIERFAGEVRAAALEDAALEVRRLAAIDQAAPKENRWLLVETFPARAHDALSALANKGSTER